MLAEQASNRGQGLGLSDARFRVVVAPATQPLQFLGHVGELQLHRAGAHERLEPCRALPLDEADQRLRRCDISLPQAGGHVTRPKHPVPE
jgi:hypothetical protein